MFLSKSEIDHTKLQERIAANFKHFLEPDAYYILRQDVQCYNADQEADGELQTVDGYGVLLKYLYAEKGANIDNDNSDYVREDNTYLAFSIVVYDEERVELEDGDTIYINLDDFEETMVKKIDSSMSQTFELAHADAVNINKERTENNRKYNNTTYILVPILLGLIVGCLIVFFVIKENVAAFGAIMAAGALFAIVSMICYVHYSNAEYILPEFFNSKLNEKYQKLKDDTKKRYTQYANSYNFAEKYLSDGE